MNHFASTRYWEYYRELPQAIQESTDKQFEILKQNPFHPSLHHEKVGNYWSVRIGMRFRALSVKKDGDFLWFWIGSHAEYDKHISSR